MKEIPLSQGQVALVDDADYDLLMQWKWSYAELGQSKKGYAVRRAGSDGGLILMHRFIMSPPEGYEPDHINRNGLDNRRSNLRLATRQQNRFNTGKRAPRRGVAPSSQYKGVCWVKKDRRWTAKITIDGQSRSLGYFKNELDAAHAYDAAARIHHGEFAKTNF